jgi:hypothetical protein
MAPGCESTLPAALASFQASPYLFGQLSSVSVYVVTVSRLAQQPTRRAEVSFWDCSIDLISLHTLLVEWHGRGIGLPVGNHAAICFPSTRGRKFGVCGMSTSNREVKVDGEEQASRPASGEIVASLKKGLRPKTRPSCEIYESSTLLAIFTYLPDASCCIRSVRPGGGVARRTGCRVDWTSSA